jgi:hypothetical protein
MELEPHFDHLRRSTSAGVRKAKVNHCVMSQAVMIATGVRADACREALGSAVGDRSGESQAPHICRKQFFSLRGGICTLTTRVRLSDP